MNNAELIKGIEAVVEGLNVIKSALGDEAMNAPETVEAPVEVSGGQYTRKQLESMKYNEFKKLAASLGVKCTGTRDEIIDRVLALNSTTTEEVSAEAEETVPAEEEKKPKRGRARKTAPVKEEVPAEEEAEDTEDEGNKKIVPMKKKLSKKEEVPAKDEFDEQAEAVAEETPAEDIITALEDAGVKATKKNYVQKLAEALREGLIELGDDDDEDEESEAEETEESVEEDEESSDDSEEISATSYFSEYDPEGINDPSGMTKKRAKAVETKMQSIIDDYSNEDITDDDISDYINDHATSDEVDALGDDPEAEECLKMYMELVKRTIDDDGEEHDPADPYEIDGHDMCCGHELKYSKKTNKYICEHCGSEYEAE